jgi:hypothetical protein
LRETPEGSDIREARLIALASRLQRELAEAKDGEKRAHEFAVERVLKYAEANGRAIQLQRRIDAMSAASSVVPPLAYKLRAVLNEYGAFIKHQIIEDAMLDAAVELERIAASSSEGSIVDDIAQLIAGGAGADTSSALPNVDIRWFLETFVKAVDFHGGLGTPSLQRAEAELLYAWATRVLSGPAHDAVSHATTSDEDAALLEMCHGTLRELVNRIEKCGASLELTRAVMLCSDLMMAVGNRWNPRDKDAAQRVRDELARAGTPISASHATTRLPGEMFENGEVRINVDEQWFYRGNRSPSWVYLGRSPNGLPTGIAERVPAECWPLLEHIAELRAPSSATRRNEHGEG